MSSLESSISFEQLSLPLSTLPSKRVQDLSGRLFEAWRVLTFSHIDKHGKAHWLCECVCGIRKAVCGSDLRSHKSESCGCPRRLYGGYDSDHPIEYRTFRSMWNRCTDPKNVEYKHYGGRGITICERWRLFVNFLSDVGVRPGPDYSLDRVNNDGNYEPGNVRWATRLEQANNTQKVRLITFNNQTHTIAEWARRLGYSYPTLHKRFKQWSLEKALTFPIQIAYRRSKP